MGENQAACRFLYGEDYDWMDVLEPHRQCTHARTAVHPVVPCLQDTTELNFNGLQRVMDFAAGIKFARDAYGICLVCNGMGCGL